MGSKNNRKDEMIEWRRAKVLELSSQGHNQSEIATNKLQRQDIAAILFLSIPIDKE